MSKASELLDMFDYEAEEFITQYNDFDISTYQGQYVVALVYVDSSDEENISLLSTSDDPDEAEESFENFVDILGEDNVVKLNWDEEEEQYSEIEFYGNFEVQAIEAFTWVIRGRKRVKKQLRKAGVRPKMNIASRRKIARTMKRQRQKLKRIAKLPSTKRKKKLSLSKRKKMRLKPTKKGYSVIGK